MPTAPLLTPADVTAAAGRLPRVPLAHLPTPLEELPRFSRTVGGGVRIFIKRDDCTGLLLGGNKARHNEFLMGDAVAHGCDVVVWGGGTQSNNCRQTAAACARLGLECHLYLSRAHGGTEPQGNLLLDYLVGAQVTFVDEPVGPALNGLIATKTEEQRRLGRKPYHWHPPRVVPRAAVSYAVCLAEIAGQLRPRRCTCRPAGPPGRGWRWGRSCSGSSRPGSSARCRGRGASRRRWPGTPLPPRN
jgi:1-aminocyclopropane-1-carboxylate deaminase/D-cysteine desulfhydrase-like pyridoxal-dependent ACC family enzyme